MATYATLTVPVIDIIGAEFNASRASVWIEPNVPAVLADSSIRVGGRREQVVNGVATFTKLCTTNSADNPASFSYTVTITAPPKGARGREDIVLLKTSEFPFTATANLKDIDEAWDDITIPVEWRSAFLDEVTTAASSVATDRAYVENLVITDLGTTDGQTKALVEAPSSDTTAALKARYARGVSVTAFGAVADWNGVTGTDNLAAFEAAHDAAEDGDQVFIPGGRYYLSDTWVITKLIRITTGASGIQQNSPGTELVFAPGVGGLWITDDGVSAPPHGVQIDPIQITSLSTGAGSDIGIRCTNGRVTLHDVAVSGFGSHGIHMKAGADYGGGNVNLSMLHTPRVYGNRGDGIRLEGSDANHITIIRPDITGNYGWGLNFEYVSSTYVLAPHIDHQYYGSPGAIRDWGDSNQCEHVYLETGDGSSDGGKIQLYRHVGFGIDSRYFRATFGYYGGAFEVEDQTTSHTHTIDSAVRGRLGVYRSETRDGAHTYRHDAGGINTPSYALVHTPSGGADRVVTEFYPPYDHYWIGAHAVPRAHNAWDLGENSQRWRDIYAQRYIRLADQDGSGELFLRCNNGVLEKSTDGSAWSAV